MLKIWGRNTSSNVQKAMWAIGELGLQCERIDIGGPFGKNNEAPYLAMNPNGVVPTLEEEDGFILWESNSIVRYLGAKHGAGTLEPADLRTRFSRAALDGLATLRHQRRNLSGVLGPHPHAAGKARSEIDRRRQGQVRRRDQDHGRISSPRPASSPATIFATAIFRSGRLPIAISGWCRTIRRCRMSSAGTRNSARALRSSSTCSTCRSREIMNADFFRVSWCCLSAQAR